VAATATGNPIAGGTLVAASKATDMAVDVATLALSEKDRIQNLVQAHKATRKNRELQELLLTPIPKLTAAFIETLSEWSKQKPIILMLDTYEKAELDTIDTWLWKSLLSNTDIQQYRIRLVIAGRYNLLRRQEWITTQQRLNIVTTYGPTKFNIEQTREYLAEIGHTASDIVQQIYQVTKGWPYYLNKIRESGQSLTPDLLTQDLASFLVRHLHKEEQAQGKLLAQLAACCRWFDATLIEQLAQQLNLSPPTCRNPAVQFQSTCFTWLREQTFIEPVSGGRLRVDDVARDVFRASLWQENQSQFERIHDLLARYFKAKTDHLAPSHIPTSEKYSNPDWRELRAEYLYHLTFTNKSTLENSWLCHLLEASYLGKTMVVQTPFRCIKTEYALVDHPHLSYTNRTFLSTIRPAIEYGWAVLGEYSTDNINQLRLTQQEVDDVVNICLGDPDSSQGIARLAVLFYLAQRSSKEQKPTKLLQMKDHAESLRELESSSFLVDLFANKLGYPLLIHEQFEDSIDCYEQALQVNPNYTDAITNKGAALFNLQRYEEALSVFCHLLTIIPGSSTGLSNKGAVLERLGRYTEAIECFDAALKINPNYSDAQQNKGLAFEKLGRYEEALANYEIALAINNKDYKAFSCKGYALYNLGRYEEAIESCDAALGINSDYSVALNHKGIALYGLGRYEEAIACYESALSLAPEDCEVLHNKGLALVGLDNCEDAISYYDAALSFKPDFFNALVSKGTALAHLKRYEEALAVYEAALSIKPNDYGALYNKGNTLKSLGRYIQAIETYDEAIAVEPHHHEVYCNKGLALCRSGRHFEAVIEFEAALFIEPDDYRAHCGMGTALFASDRKEEALAAYAAALAKKPDFYEALSNKGHVLHSLGRYEEAMAAFNAARNLNI
jgi:tetratricopeptide (TPR) repeat protein